MEQSEHAFYRSLGLSISPARLPKTMGNLDTDICWPRVHVECDFHSPARFEDELVDRVAIGSLNSKSVTFEHSISLGDKLIATGRMTSVCCRLHAGAMNSQEIPPAIRILFSPYLKLAVP
jgi:acyl-CoA thioester hydrolase